MLMGRKCKFGSIKVYKIPKSSPDFAKILTRRLMIEVKKLFKTSAAAL